MSLPRASLFLLSLPLTLAGAAALLLSATAQPLPSGLSRQGGVVMMQPIADGAGMPAADGARPSNLRILSPADHALFVRAFDAGQHGDWVGARALASQGTNPVARQLVQWRYALDKNSGASFAEIDQVLRDTDTKGAATWPGRGTLYARAEQAITPDMPAGTLVAWFGARTPATAIGKLRLGEALIAGNQVSKGRALIARGWVEGSFDSPTELDIVTRDGAYLTPESDRARLDALLWRGETSAARRQMARVDAASAVIANARIALTGGIDHARDALAAAANSSDPGLLLDWSRALRIANRDSEAHAMLLRVPAGAMIDDHAARWWNETSIQARDALGDSDPRTALALIAHAGFTSGDQYAEQQFLGGFVALRALKDAAGALPWFQRLDAGVARPISKARAQYWQGRAYEAMGDARSAALHYRQAAAYPETFYGQLALMKADANAVLRLTDTPVDAAPASELDADALMPQIKVLADLGQEGSLRLFVDRDAAVYPAPRHLKRLMMALTEWGYREIAVRLAKTASYAGTTLPAYTHPLIPLPAYRGPGTGPDPALVLGLIRQETEFDPYAVSSAGARGLMQIMPATIRTSSRAAGIDYRPADVMRDTEYNIQLGMAEYLGHFGRYGGSNILAIASYNGGPNNVKKWLARNGDPRSGADPVDWVEEIPFGETRNYVQRVLENAEVYRNRLQGRETPLRILSDLYAPVTPPANGP